MQLQVQYGSGNANGVIAQETVSMGGYTVASQTFGVINKMDKSLLSGPVDGIMGLSWQTLARTKGESHLFG